MDFVISKYFPGVRPGVTMPSKQMFVLLGEEGMRKMVSDFYDLLAQSEIKDLFPKNPIALEKAKEHSADFFIQILVYVCIFIICKFVRKWNLILN